MKNEHASSANSSKSKKGYNEKNPGQPEGAFPPASNASSAKKTQTKSNTADKKQKEDQN